jgi:hypothetical protein
MRRNRGRRLRAATRKALPMTRLLRGAATLADPLSTPKGRPPLDWVAVLSTPGGAANYSRHRPVLSLLWKPSSLLIADSAIH